MPKPEEIAVRVCRKCGSIVCANEEKVKILPGQLLEIFERKVSSCDYCPTELRDGTNDKRH